jgi:serine/threonine protein kinase
VAELSTVESFLEAVKKSGLIEDKDLDAFLSPLRNAGELPEAPRPLAQRMLQASLLTRFQAEQLLLGKTRGFTINGKYRLLEHLGAGGMGQVYLCEHISMRRRVAIKILPLEHAKDPSYLERFYREARAVAALDHPNIVRAHDIDREGKIHFLVMEFVDGSSLQDIVARHGPLSTERAAHYISQAAWGLQHAHEAGLVHRDIKPGNLLLDRAGVVKVLDLGLARFFHDDDSLSKKYDETVLGTSDYLAPEQALDSHVDIRADIYSLGATFYFLLTGHTLFGKGTASQKIIWHQTRQPKSIQSYRPEIPAELADLIEQRMLAKDPAQRFQVPGEVCDALAPWTETPIGPPPDEEMPHLSPAALRSRPGDVRPGNSPPTLAPSSKRSWVVSGSASERRTPTVQRGAPAPTATRVPAGDSATAPVSEEESVKEMPGPDSSAPTVVKAPSSKSRTVAEEPLPEPSTGRWAPRTLLRNPGTWVAAAGVLLLGVAGVWWALTQRSPTPTTSPAPPEQVRPGPTPPVGPLPAEGVAIQQEKDERRVKTPAYEAIVASDGCLTSLRVQGVELLWVGGPTSRGSYFFQNGALKLPAIEQPAANVLTAKSDKAAIRYEFGRDSLTWTVTNATDAGMPFFLVFTPAVRAVLTNTGEWAKTPAAKKDQCPTTTWFAGPARLKVTGGTSIWGPFDGPHQVWQSQLPPRETRKLTLEPGAVTEAEATQVASVTKEVRIRQAKYDATIEDDGCLTSLKVGGVEFLKPGVDVSRGFYFHQGDLVKLPTVDRPAPNVVTAKGDKAAIRYEFGPDTLTLTATNSTNQPMAFFAVLDPETVGAVLNDDGEWAKVPVERRPDEPVEKKWQTNTWFAGEARLKISGGTKIWGPWSNEDLQVWEATLAPQETRKVVLEVGTASNAEKVKVAATVGGKTTTTDADLAVSSPLNYQVFQRYSRHRGQIALQGKVRPPCDKVEARLTGTSLDGPLPGKWESVDFAPEDRSFDTTLPVAAGGWYRLELRAMQKGKAVAEWTVEKVGVGEVFVIAGQSNATNCGEERIRTATGMVSSFSGTRWQPGNDPQPGVHDKTGGGSCWAPFGDALYQKYKVPVGIASTGHSGSSVREWQPGSVYFKWMMKRIGQLGTGGFRAVLWHQGESDVRMTPDEYAKLLTNVIEASKKEAGWDFPWCVAQVSYHNPANPSFSTTREGQRKLWETKVALEGPDTDTLTGDNRDGGGKGIHFSGKGQRAHGKMWADKISVYLDRVLAE